MSVVDNLHNAQEQFKKIGNLLDGLIITPTVAGQTSYQFVDVDDDSVDIDIEAVQLADYNCSGTLTDLPVCLSASIDGNVFMAMRLTYFDKERWTQWFVIEPAGTTLSEINPDPVERSNLFYIKAQYREDTDEIVYSWSGNIEWSGLLISDLEAECRVSTPDPLNTYAKCFKNDWYFDDVQMNSVANENFASVWLQVNTPNGVDENLVCVDENGLEVDQSNCSNDASELDPVSSSDDPDPNSALSVQNVAVVMPVDDETVTLDEQLTVSWDNRDDASSYNLYWSTSSEVTKANGTKITGVTSPYTHSGLTNGTDYYYVVAPDSTYATGTPKVDTVGTEYFDSVVADISGGDGYDFSFDVAVDSENRIYVTGYSHITATSSSRMFLMRFTPEGVLDTTFNNPTGYVLAEADVPGDDMHGMSIKIEREENDSYIYVFGYSNISGTDYPTIWKYTENGVLDTNFSDDGYVIAAFPGRAYAGALSLDSEAILGGYDSSWDGAIWGFLDDDLNFTFTHEHPTLSATRINNIAVDENGKIYFTGDSYSSDVQDNVMILGRLHSNGALDIGSIENNDVTQGFGEDYDLNGRADGYTYFDSSSDDIEGRNAAYYGYGVVVGPHKNIWVGGKYYLKSPDESGKGIIWRYDVTGMLDTDFGIEDGDTRLGYQKLSTCHEESCYVFVEDIVFDDYDRVIVATKMRYDLAVWRLDMNGDFDTDFGPGIDEIVPDPDGDPYTSGFPPETVTYPSDGLVIFGADNGYSETPKGVELDQHGNVIIGGYRGTVGDYTTSIIKLWKIE